MKYKNIKSMLHNYGHSFCSLMNYVDNQYIIDILPKLLKRSEQNAITISFPSGNVEGLRDIPDTFQKSIKFNSEWLPRHMSVHSIEADKIFELKLEILPATATSKTSAYGFECVVSCKDDRGKYYEVRVNQRNA